ncbi:hypothetical protein ACHAQJ_000810 [Trichoderma viride]
MTFVDILRQRTWLIIVKEQCARFERLWKESMEPAPFIFPHGDKHWFDLARYESQFEEGVSKGSQFPVSVNFSDMSSMQAVLTQSAVQDCLWIAIKVAMIFAKKHPAYFVPTNKDAAKPSRFFAIVAMESQYRKSIDKIWSRVAKDGFLRLAFHENMSPMDAPSLTEFQKWHTCAESIWDAKIMENANKIDALKDHPLTEFDLVLLIQRPRSSKTSENDEDVQKDVEDVLEQMRIKTFSSCGLANQELQSWNSVSLLFDPQLSDLERKVRTVNQYMLPPVPSHLGGCKLPEDGQIPDELKFRMHMHAALQLDRRFPNLVAAAICSSDSDSISAMSDLVSKLSVNTAPAEKTVEWNLPKVSLLKIDDKTLNCLMEEISEEDRGRFQQYMGNLPLGFGIITAGPGFGKTSVLGVATLGMAHSVQKVYVSAPTHVAVDNFARRIDMLDQRVVARHNKSLTEDDDQTPIRRKLIIRGFPIRDEIKAFRNLLQRPKDGDAAAPKKEFRGVAKWKLHLSLTYWLLKALGSPAVPALNEEDNKDIQLLHDELEKHSIFAPLADVARGKLSWNDYLGHESNSQDKLVILFEKLIQAADLVCTTPALSEKVSYHKWKTTCAKGIAVDEAANMGRPDLYCGQYLTPLRAGGDDKQLMPSVMTADDMDEESKHLNRHAEDGKLSALAFYKANSWPIYCLHTQFRMARGMFDLCHEMFYSAVPFEYAPGCDPSLESHADGAKLEVFLKQRFPAISPPAPDTMEPVCVHCPGSFTWRNPSTGSKSNVMQCEVALRLLVDLVNVAKVDPLHIGIIAPYKANVAIMERWIEQKSDYSVLRGMAPPATVDSYQGQEADIMCVILGTTKTSGPGFTNKVNRLNVMLSRQKSGLIVVGDIKLAAFEQAQQQKGKGKGKGKGKDEPYFGGKLTYMGQENKKQLVQARGPPKNLLEVPVKRSGGHDD